EGCGCLLELSRTALDRCARAVAGVEGEGDREASGLDAVPQYLVEEVGQSRASILMLDQRRRQAAQLVDPLTEDGMHERVARGEVAAHGRRSHAGIPGDLLRGGIRAARGNLGPRDLKDERPVSSRIGAQ